ncbi:hypothetical protein ACKFKG_24910 [Phormidesmis sp. 146-35]
MLKLTAVPVPQTLQELDEAVKQFQASDFSGEELIRHWQAIREASLKEFVPEREGDPWWVSQGDCIPGEESY